MELIKVFGFKKFLLALIVTTLECTAIFLVIYLLMSIFAACPVLGAIILSAIFVVMSAVGGLIYWKKRNGNKKKDL